MYASGPLEVLSLPKHAGFQDLRRTPRETRRALNALGYVNVVAFQTRNPMHRVHEELTKRACEQVGGSLLIHPTIGMTMQGDVDPNIRVRAYSALVQGYYDQSRTLLSLLPLAMRMAGPREALWHAIIRRNYGANHFIVGRDHASPGRNAAGVAFYGPFAAQGLVEEHGRELGVRAICSDELVYLPDEERYETRPNVRSLQTVWSVSGTKIRRDYLEFGRDLPGWLTRPEVASVLSQTYVPRWKRGFCVWITGLPCAGKTTVSEQLVERLTDRGRIVTWLDGDVVRLLLSRGLGFSAADRVANNERMALVAAEVVRHGGIAVCAAVSAFEEGRRRARELVGADKFVLVYLSTPVAVCEGRDVKGMYGRARRGEIQGFTGIDGLYEVPPTPDLQLDTSLRSVRQCVDTVLTCLEAKGFLPIPGSGKTSSNGSA